MARSFRAAAGVVATLVFLACSDSRSERQTKPTFDWGYPEYSQYTPTGEHVGTHFYQQDPVCRHRLTFYECAFVDAETPNNPETNPTGASDALTGAFDTCTAAITEERPSYCIPADICNPTRQLPAWAPGQGSSDNLAWQLFIALNWPANPDEPGYPDTTRQPGALDPSGEGHAKTVWLDYPTAEELFGVPSPCTGPTLQMRSKRSAAFLSKFPPGASNDPARAGDGLLVDQNGGIVHFEVRVNRTEWEFIVNQNDYWKTGASLDALKRNLRRDYNLPPGQTPGGFPAAKVLQDGKPGDIGSMEIKAAWKPLTPAEIASGTFFTRTFALYDPSAPPERQCEQRTMGLVAMHVVYQPAIFSNPEWMWATFEHRANVPTARVNDGATSFSFYDPSCTPVKTPEECATYQPGVSSPAEFRCCPNLNLYPEGTSAPERPVPSQITRVTDPTVSAIIPTNCTEQYTAAIRKYFGEDNVWLNYFLVSTQWPRRGPGDTFPAYVPTYEANFPCTLRNAAIESFLVGPEPPAMNGCNLAQSHPFCRACNGDCVSTAEEASAACPGGQEPPGSFTTADCMGCHSTYAAHNSSFIFLHRPCCVRADGFLPNVCGVINDRAACEAMQACTWVASDPACAQ